MTKAILVIDMPKTCYECPLIDSGNFLMYKCFYNDNEFEFINGERKDFCPLKPMPKKKEFNNYDDYIV